MAVIVQVIRINGSPIEEAKWEVKKDFPIGIGSVIHVSIPGASEALARCLLKYGKSDCHVDVDQDQPVLIAKCIVVDVKIMLETATKTTESMVIVTPANNLVEGAILSILCPSGCGIGFMSRLARFA